MNNSADQRRMEPLARMLLATAGLLGAIILLELATFVVAGADAEDIVAEAKDSTPGTAAAAPSMQMRSVVDGLKKSNLFAPPRAKQNPVSEVVGILGDRALINGQWYKVGDHVADATILAIEPTKVRVVWNGQEKEFAPMNSTGSTGAQGPGPGRRPSPPASKGAPMVVTGSSPGPMNGPGQGIRATEEMARMREQWQNMSPEERQRYREEMRAKFGRRSR
ncbi:MAG: hypothetical protein JW955_07830 [Sedimentisphaerales bacterium]|nr:hypothetical protein [Sedimentisphaerales bacterium]